MPKSVPKRIQTCFRVIFSKKFNAKCSMEGRVFENFQKKIRKVSKFQKCPKSFPKVSKRVLNVFWGKFFENFFAQCSVEGQVFEEFQNFFLNFQKGPKVFPKVSKRVLNMFCGKSFGKFLPSFRWNVESSKIFKNFFFKIPKMPKSVPKRIQTCFRVIFSKKFNARCSMEGRVFKNFQKKIRKVSKFQKCPKLLPKISKRVLNLFWVKFFE